MTTPFVPQPSHAAVVQHAAHLLARLAPQSATAQPDPAAGAWIELYHRDDWSRRKAEAAKAASEVRDVLLAALRTLQDGGTARRLAPAPDWRAVAALKDRHPHFEVLIESIVDAVVLSHRGTQPSFALPPQLLVGPPGTGKTTFARELAAVVGTGYEFIGLAGGVAGFELGGLSQGWSTARAGRIHSLLAAPRACANPVVVLDELDKAAQAGERWAATGPLYTLLEPSSARRFTDEFVLVPIDASHINWIATANEADLLEPALRSRLTEVRVRYPTPDEARRIAAGVYRDLRGGAPWGRSFAPEINPAVAEALCEDSPRSQRRRLTAAFARAARAGRYALLVADLPALPEADAGSTLYARPRAGFTAELRAAPRRVG